MAHYTDGQERAIESLYHKFYCEKTEIWNEFSFFTSLLPDPFVVLPSFFHPMSFLKMVIKMMSYPG